MNLLQTQTNIYNFLKQFAQPYMEQEVPQGAVFPYMTYIFDMENWRTTGLGQVRIWDEGESTQTIFGIAEAIEDMVGEGFISENLIIHAGSPFVQIMPQEEENIKCLYMNLEIDYL